MCIHNHQAVQLWSSGNVAGESTQNWVHEKLIANSALNIVLLIKNNKLASYKNPSKNTEAKKSPMIQRCSYNWA